MAYHRHIPETNDRNGLIVMASLFSVLSILAVTLRFYARKLSRLHFLEDDWFSLVSLCFVLGLNGIFIAGTVQGAITGHSIVVNNWPQTSELEHLAEKYKYAFQATEKPAFGVIKLSILFPWKRIFRPVKSFQICCWVMIGVVVLWSIAFFFGTVFQCGIELPLNWAPMDDFLAKCSNTFDMLCVFAVTDVVTDIVILIMPIPLIWQLNMSNQRKAGITSVFLIGIFTIGAGIARLVLYLGTDFDVTDDPDFMNTSQQLRSAYIAIQSMLVQQRTRYTD